ncbi:gamma-aminobutyric acid type B receptor subunit 1-like [Lineus longissimus]|uniref:gamma-aminobutyric acid type B receptor subunit 1-like n=1 Tax=Lineus longissimus TaxID=88925 RepID=UPI002B4EDB34
MIQLTSLRLATAVRFLLVLSCVRPGQLEHPTGKNKDIWIGGIFPMEGGWAGGNGCFPATIMALQDVNARSDILPGYRLQMAYNDSKCSAGLGTKAMYELLYNPPTKIIFLVGCSLVSTFVAQAAKMWNLVVLSYGSSSPALSDRTRFPTFFRTHPSANLQNPTRIKLIKRWNFSRIATIQQIEEVFTSTIQDLENKVKNEGIEIAIRTSFLNDPTNAVKSLKRQDARVIIGVFYEGYARRVFCEAYKQGLYGKKYVWFLIGWYADDWYLLPNQHVNCTKEEMKKAVEGHFTTESMMLNQADVATVSGMTSSEFQQRLINVYLNNTNPNRVVGYPEAPLAYDAVWATALALDKVTKRLAAKNRSIEEFHYHNKEIYDEIFKAVNETKFLGVSGPVYFTKSGDRIAWTQIEQMVDGKYNKVGYYDYFTNNLSWLGGEKWIGGKPPPDQTAIVLKLRVVSMGLYIGMSVVATQGIIIGLVCLLFNTFNQHRSHIRQSTPVLNSVTAVGCMICLTTIFLLGLDGRFVSERTYPILCQMRVWVLSIGFTLAYGSMFTKVWTVYRLAIRRKKDSRMNIQPCEIYIVLAILLIIDLIFLTVWHIMDPLRRILQDFPKESPKDTDADVLYVPQLEQCTCTHLTIWLGVILGYKGLLLMFGILLSYETRSVKIKTVNDSRFVGMGIYNVVVLSIITAPVTLIISDQQDASFAFVASAIILCCFLSMGLIFVPKIFDIIRHPNDAQETAALTEALANREEEERHQRLLAENEELKKQIAEKEERIKDLNKRIQLRSESRARMQSTSSFSEKDAVVIENTGRTYSLKVESKNLLTPPPGKIFSEEALSTGDGNSDSAMAMSSTMKSSSKTSDEHDETFSESCL